jgi:hypothetical protein
VRIALVVAGLPEHFWNFAILHAPLRRYASVVVVLSVPLLPTIQAGMRSIQPCVRAWMVGMDSLLTASFQIARHEKTLDALRGDATVVANRILL